MATLHRHTLKIGSIELSEDQYYTIMKKKLDDIELALIELNDKVERLESIERLKLRGYW